MTVDFAAAGGAILAAALALVMIAARRNDFGVVFAILTTLFTAFFMLRAISFEGGWIYVRNEITGRVTAFQRANVFALEVFRDGCRVTIRTPDGGSQVVKTEQSCRDLIDGEEEQ